jgi:hypothetical protein
VIPIEETKRIDWNAIRAEYIGGGISQRKLAAKHGIPVDKLLKIANREHWKDDREKASNKAAIVAQQKTAVAAADNAVLAADIKKRLLMRLSRAEKKFPMDATEVRTQVGKSTAIFKLRDLTAAYKDLTGDMPKETDNGALERLDRILEEVVNAANAETG